LILKVDKLGSIAGRVVRAGQPVDGAQVTVGKLYTTSDGEGAFVISNIKPGTYNVGGDSQRLGAFTKGPSIELAAGEQRTGVDVELELAGAISGIVVDQNYAPVPGVFVSFSLLHGRDFGIATTSDDGTFHARTLSGGGEYTYEVHASQRSPIAFRAAGSVPFAPVTVKDGTTSVEGLRIRIQVDHLAIAGRVVDATDHGVADLTVRAVPAGRQGPNTSAPTTTTDASGAFALHDLPAGKYDITAHGAQGDAHDDGVDAAGGDVVLHLTGLGSVEGALTDFSDPPEVVLFRGDRNDHPLLTPTITATSFHVADVPAGIYYVIAKAKAGFDESTITVAPGAPTKVTLRQRGFGAVVGTVRDGETHAPVGGLSCSATSDDRILDSLRRQNDAGKPVTSDASGGFRIDHVLEGATTVTCSGDKTAKGHVTVVKSDTARLDLDTSSVAKP
jgi:hypothetical protein